MAEVSSSYSERPIVNYGVSTARKTLYHSSKEPKEGYKEVKNKEGGVSYHRDVQGLTGKITKVEIRDSKIGKQLCVNLSDNEQISVIQIGLKNQAYQKLIDSIYNADLSEEVIVSFYGKKDKVGKEWQNCYCAYNQKKDDKGKNIPVEWLNTDDKPKPKQNKAGDWIWTDVEDWYYDKIQELTNRVEKFKLDKGMDSKPVIKDEKEREMVTTDKFDLPF